MLLFIQANEFLWEKFTEICARIPWQKFTGTSIGNKSVTMTIYVAASPRQQSGEIEEKLRPLRVMSERFEWHLAKVAAMSCSYTFKLCGRWCTRAPIGERRWTWHRKHRVRGSDLCLLSLWYSSRRCWKRGRDFARLNCMLLGRGSCRCGQTIAFRSWMREPISSTTCRAPPNRSTSWIRRRCEPNSHPWNAWARCCMRLDQGFESLGPLRTAPPWSTMERRPWWTTTARRCRSPGQAPSIGSACAGRGCPARRKGRASGRRPRMSQAHAAMSRWPSASTSPPWRKRASTASSWRGCKTPGHGGSLHSSTCCGARLRMPELPLSRCQIRRAVVMRPTC